MSLWFDWFFGVIVRRSCLHSILDSFFFCVSVCICVPCLFSATASCYERHRAVQEDIDLTNCLFLTNKQCKPDNKLPKHLTFFARYIVLCLLIFLLLDDITLLGSMKLMKSFVIYRKGISLVLCFVWFGPTLLMRDQRYWFTFQFVKMWFNGFCEI